MGDLLLILAVIFLSFTAIFINTKNNALTAQEFMLDCLQQLIFTMIFYGGAIEHFSTLT